MARGKALIKLRIKRGGKRKGTRVIRYKNCKCGVSIPDTDLACNACWSMELAGRPPLNEYSWHEMPGKELS